MTEVLYLAAALLLVVACGLFVAAEFAFLTVDRASVERAAADGRRGADGTRRALKTLSTQLSGAQLGITVTNLAIGFLAEPAIGRLVRPPLESAGLPGALAATASYAVAFALSTGLTMVFGELVPKNLAIARPLETSAAVQGFMRGFTAATRPLLVLLNGSANAVLRRVFGVEPQEELASARSADELTSLVARSAEQGTLERETAVLVQRSLAFGTRRADDAMTPRTRVTTLSADESLLDLLAAVHATGRSRFPVVDAGPDDVVGVVHARQVLDADPAERGTTTLGAVAARPLLVPETMELDALLDALKGTPLQMAVVVDEFGGFAGVVTFEDLVEEIVGEVVDEHDAERPPAHRLADGGWLVSGLLRPDEASRHLGVPLPEDDDYETIAGLLGLHLGRLPVTGDVVEVPVTVRSAFDDEDAGPRARAVRMEVEALDGLRVDQVRVDVLHEDGPAGPPGELDVRDDAPGAAVRVGAHGHGGRR
ncbi:hemolysin family protein [Kineococcus terrestris]|uniref:hemolysin family protein n=1 Tax=Kineococcus terrestris TaxID=2044856 RepID=UPI0034DB33DC